MRKCSARSRPDNVRPTPAPAASFVSPRVAPSAPLDSRRRRLWPRLSEDERRWCCAPKVASVMTPLAASASIDVGLEVVASVPETDEERELIPVVLVGEPSDKVRFNPDQLWVVRRLGAVVLLLALMSLRLGLCGGAIAGEGPPWRRAASRSLGRRWVYGRSELVMMRESGVEWRRAVYGRCWLLFDSRTSGKERSDTEGDC